MTPTSVRLCLRLATIGGAMALAACSLTPPPGGATVQANLEPTTGNRAAGTVTFLSGSGGKVNVHARVTGLTPSQEHGFHIHENGDCSSRDGMSAGGHFNPDAKPHGPQAAPHHVGDMPSLRADASGTADMRFVLTDIELGGTGSRNIVGRSVIVHAQPDDYRTQPTGNSGARLACAVIR